MAKMTEEAKAKLRGRPRNATRMHKYGSETERNVWLGRLVGVKHSGGLTCLKRYFSGELLKPRDAIKAVCCQCLGYYADGLMDCECPSCPLYHYMPYRKKDMIFPC